MCGISGLIHNSDLNLSGVLATMNQIAQHRGPDDEGYLLVSAKRNEVICAGGNDTPADSWEMKTVYQPTHNIHKLDFGFNIGLAHRRLSILDLSPLGHLPMGDATSKYWITYNGEVYNYLEIRNELVELGHVFNTDSDTEVIIKAYIQWGKTCVEKFEGMYAFAIVDLNNREVFLARDIFGIKPLYYWVSNEGTFYFASEIKQFTSIPGWQPIMNKRRAFDYLYYGLTDHTEETLFKNVFQLKPAHYFSFYLDALPQFSQGRPIHSKSYFEFNPASAKQNFNDASIAFKKLFEQSVNLHLRSDVPIGSALSGGLDSSAIVCEINKILSEAGKTDLQKTFSATSDNPKFSEKKWMDEVVNFTKVEAHFVTPKPSDVFKLTKKILWQMDEPYQSQSAFLGYHVFELAAKNNVKVLLNGQGADEYLSGYEEFRMLRWYKLFKGLKWIKLGKELYFYYGLNPKSYASQLVKFATYMLPDAWQEKFSKNSSVFKSYAKFIPPNNFFKDFEHPFKEYNSKRKSHIGLIKHQLYCSPLPRFLRWEDRNSMAHSVEARVPFLNKKLIEFAMGQPLDFLDAKNASKRLMVESLKELLPPKIYQRKDKKGFITAEEQWMKEDLDGEFESNFDASLKLLGNLVQPDEAKKYYLTLKAGKIPFDYIYWRLILMGIWVEVFKIEIEK